MAIDTAQLSAQVAGAIGQVGVAIHIRRENRSTDQNTGEVTVNATMDIPWISTPLLPYEDREIDGDTVRREDSRILLAPVSEIGAVLNIVPRVGDEIIFKYGSNTAQQVWRVMNVKHFSAGDIDEVSAYDLQLRRR